MAQKVSLLQTHVEIWQGLSPKGKARTRVGDEVIIEIYLNNIGADPISHHELLSIRLGNHLHIQKVYEKTLFGSNYLSISQLSLKDNGSKLRLNVNHLTPGKEDRLIIVAEAIHAGKDEIQVKPRLKGLSPLRVILQKTKEEITIKKSKSTTHH